MTTDDRPEGDIVFELIYGKGERPRDTAPEPSLLPHLAGYLCHDFSLYEVLGTAMAMGTYGSPMHPFPALYHATLWAACLRPDMVAFMGDFHPDYDLALATAMLAHTPDQAKAQTLFDDYLASPDWQPGEDPPMAAAARLVRFLGPSKIKSLLTDDRFDPGTLDPESARTLLLAHAVAGIEPDSAWLTRAMSTDVYGGEQWERDVHLLPHLPEPIRTPLADQLAQEIDDRLNAHYRALMVSRIAPFVSSARAFNYRSVLAGLDDVWSAHIDVLLRAAWDDAPWADVMRAHPEHEALRNVKRAHEVTTNAPCDIGSRWGLGSGPPEASGATRGEPEEAAPPPSPAPAPAEPGAGRPPNDEPRALQASVMLEDDMSEVQAFVAGQTHLLDVSIGRGASVRADQPFDERVFDDATSDWLVLPVWFTVNGETQKDKLRVPRDQSKNSRTVTFSLTAPAAGLVIAHVHVMRPDGTLLLQSAVLAGTVVATAGEAASHAAPIALTIDVVAGDLADPISSDNGAAVIVDDASAVATTPDALVDLDTSLLGSTLGQMVELVELAAERRDVDDTAIDRQLEALAQAGQQLRAQLDGPLQSLMDKDTLQVVSLRDGDVLPLELVYDGPALSSSSKICPTWRKALQAGHCGGCADGGPDADDAPARVCPRRFWSMQKVIERRTQAGGRGFKVGSEPTASRPHLRPVSNVIVGASGRVDEADVEAVSAHAAQCFGVSAPRVTDWSHWRSVIATTDPDVLLAMPHDHLLDSGLVSALMMGEPADEDIPPPPSTELLSGAVNADVVMGENRQPGPVVFLLGCNTLFHEGRLSSFAGEFRAHGAALTVATLGKLVVDQAPAATRVLVDLMSAPPPGVTTMGEIMLHARRQLLSDNMIMALLLVANGDAAWQLPQ